MQLTIDLQSMSEVSTSSAKVGYSFNDIIQNYDQLLESPNDRSVKAWLKESVEEFVADVYKDKGKKNSNAPHEEFQKRFKKLKPSDEFAHTPKEMGDVYNKSIKALINAAIKKHK